MSTDPLTITFISDCTLLRQVYCRNPRQLRARHRPMKSVHARLYPYRGLLLDTRCIIYLCVYFYYHSSPNATCSPRLRDVELPTPTVDQLKGVYDHVTSCSRALATRESLQKNSRLSLRLPPHPHSSPRQLIQTYGNQSFSETHSHA